MKKFLSLLIFVPFSVFAKTADPVLNKDFSLTCVWQKSMKHNPGYFVEGASFQIDFFSNSEGRTTKAKLVEDSFLNRLYDPCWERAATRTCSFSYGYNADGYWNVDDEADMLIQDWRVEEAPEEGTVDGVSTLKMNMGDKMGTVVIEGDDGDGVTFTENFKCSSPEIDAWIDFIDSL